MFPSDTLLEQQAQSLVAGAPFPIGVYIGPEMRIQLANDAILEVWGKGRNVFGNVFTTGIPFQSRNQRVDIVKDGVLQPFYFNYNFTPLYDKQGRIYGVMNTAANVTDLQVALQRIEQSEWNFRNMILQAPVAMCWPFPMPQNCT